jgi:primary-amine oxidase
MRRLLSALGVVALLGAVPVALDQADAAVDFNCSANYQVDRIMANDARWQMCWEVRNNEGVVLHDVTYTPDGGTPVEVLGRASLAEIHVPYDDNGARFHDLSDYGLGNYLEDYVAADCPGGTLSDDGGGPDILCQTELPIGYGIKDYDTVGQATTLNLHSTSCIGAYCYTVAWNFDDDGTIRPEVGASGSLQRLNGPAYAGWPTGNGNSQYAVAHMHNFYWRLDFDINDTVGNDRVEELEARPVSGSQRQRFDNTRTGFTREVARRVAPGAFRSWRVRDLAATNADGHPISWELLPNTDHVFRGPNYEPFTFNDLYVTRINACERFATHNPGNCADDVSGFVNNQPLNGDLVVWYGSSFHHLPRDEDEDHMHPHNTGFSIVPRDLTATNPEP